MPDQRLSHEHPNATPSGRRWSSIVAIGTAITLSLGVMPITAAAQGPPPTRAQLDSIRERLDDAEAAIEALREQLATEASSALRTRSRVALEFNGRILMNAFRNSKETNNTDVPMYRYQVAPGSPKGGTAMSIRQTTLGVAVQVADVLGGRFTGDLDVDFFGGQQPSGGGRTFPLMRLRTARAVVDWEHGQLLIGQEQPLVAGLNPVSLATVGTPGFSYAGNLWFWLPQVRGTVQTTGKVRLGLQGAVLAPMSADPQGAFDTQFDAAERTNMPFLQARVRAAWGEDGSAGEIGVGIHAGRINDAAGDAHDSKAVTADLLVPIGSRLELRGEFYTGQLVRGLGGGAIGQGFGVGGTTPVSTTAGWGQLNFRVTPRVLVGAGYGFDDPEDSDLAPTGTRWLNVVQEAHVHWRPAGPLVFGFEWRSIRTRYDASDYPNTHLNLALGFEF